MSDTPDKTDFRTKRWSWHVMPDGKIMLYLFFDKENTLNTLEVLHDAVRNAASVDEIALGFELPNFKEQFIPANGWQLIQNLTEKTEDAKKL